MNAVTQTCPPLEDIAAFLDGKLSAGERARVVAHLADCESCYAVFSSAARFQLEEEEESRTPEASRERAPAPVVPLQRRMTLRWALPLAAALVLGLATIPLYLQYSSRMPEMVSTELVDPAVVKVITADKLWADDLRGGGEPEVGLNEAAEFLIGAHLIDLRLTLERNDPESANVMSRISSLMKMLLFKPPQAQFYEIASAKIDPVEGAGIPPRHFLAEAIRTEKELTEYLAPATYPAFGKWTEAARLAAIARRLEQFKGGKNRRFLLWLLKNSENENLAPEVITELHEIRKLLAVDELQKRHYKEVETRLDKVLNYYQRESRSGSPF